VVCSLWESSLEDEAPLGVAPHRPQTCCNLLNRYPLRLVQSGKTRSSSAFFLAGSNSSPAVHAGNEFCCAAMIPV
jgi:hypothetical protein